VRCANGTITGTTSAVNAVNFLLQRSVSYDGLPSVTRDSHSLFIVCIDVHRSLVESRRRNAGD
jgi:hypothetical protein